MDKKFRGRLFRPQYRPKDEKKQRRFYGQNRKISRNAVKRCQSRGMVTKSAYILDHIWMTPPIFRPVWYRWA